MWNPFVFNDNNYLIKCNNHTTRLKICITDFKHVWVEDITIEVVLKTFKELNPLFDTDSLSSEEIVSRIESLVNGIYLETNVLLTKENEIVILELKRKIQEFNIKYKFHLMIGNADTFFDEFTLPLMQSIQYLEVRQKKLFDFLEKKDREIQEHQLEGGSISRKNLITKKFDKNAILDNAPEELLVNLFGKSKVFLETFINKYGTVAKVNVKTEVDNIDGNSRKKFKSEIS